MTRVWICQCLCPQRHAILANSGEARDVTDASELAMMLRATVKEMIGDGTINPWCGLCHAKVETWTYDLGRTRFATMAEAKPYLEENARQQRLTALIWGER